MPRPGWLQRQFDRAATEIQHWPSWMLRESAAEGQPESGSARDLGELNSRRENAEHQGEDQARQ